MSERNNVLILLALFAIMGLAATAMQIFQGSDITEITVSLNNTGNLDTPVQSITYSSQSRADIKSMLDTHIVSGYSDPRYLFNGDYFSEVALVTLNGSQVESNTGIPLALNINLPNSRSDGGDIRLAQLDGTPIAREIEWKWGNDDALIHYPLDTTLNTDSQFYVYWGNPDLTEPAAGSAYGSQVVWDVNYIGVWHMNNDPSGTAPQLKDSTVNANHGTSYGSMTTGDLIDGVYEKGIDFDGTDDYFDVGGLSSASAYTIEATADGTGVIFSSYIDASNIVNLQINSATSSTFFLKDGGSNYLAKTDGSSENLKHYWGGAFDSGTGSVYRDGSLYYSASGKTSSGIVSNNNLIGKRNDAASWRNGNFYELRISNVARSTDYITTTHNNLNNPTETGADAFYTSIIISSTIAQITPSNVEINSIDNTTAIYGSYPIIPANTEQDFILNGTQNFNYTIDFTPTDLTVTTSSSVLYADRSHTFNAVVKDHNTGIVMSTQPDKVKYRLVGSGNTSVSAKEFVGTSLTLPALQKGTYTLFTSVGWDNIPSWSNEISQSVVFTDAATPVQAAALSVVEALTDTTTDTTSNETTKEVLVGAPGRIVDGWKSIFVTIITLIKNIIHNVSVVFS